MESVSYTGMVKVLKFSSFQRVSLFLLCKRLVNFMLKVVGREGMR